MGKGSAQSYVHLGHEFITEIDPSMLCRQLVKVIRVSHYGGGCQAGRLHILSPLLVAVTIITGEHFSTMKDDSNMFAIGHFDIEIDVKWLDENCVEKVISSHRWHRYLLKSGNHVILLAEGRLVNLGCAMGHPSFVMSNILPTKVLLN